MRSGVRRHGSVVALMVVSLLASLAVLSGVRIGLAADPPSYVTGRITTEEPLSPSGSAVAVVTIVDRSARGGSGVIVGQKRIADPGPTPISFKLAYDPGRIQDDHSYVAFAAIVDGDRSWQNRDGVPVITGGPTSDVAVRVRKVSSSPPATVRGEITKNDRTALTGKAVAIAAVLDTDSGRIVAWTLKTPSGDVPIDFTLGFDPATLAPQALLATWAAIVDGTSTWEAGSAQPLVAAGSQLSAGSINVSSSTPLPTPPQPTPTPRPTDVVVPDVRGLPQAEAVVVLEDDDLRVDETKKNHHDSVPKGDAIKTEPSAGTEVPPKSLVDLFVSKGPRTVVPDVRGMPETEAVAVLEAVGLVISETKKNHHESVPKGDAIKTDPAAGTEVSAGSSVILFISKGPKVVVPDVRAMSESQAVAALDAASLGVGETKQMYHQNVAAGLAVKTDPAAGTEVPAGSSVILFMSKGPSPSPTPSPSPPPKVTVPDVKGAPEEQAVATLEGDDLRVDETRRNYNGNVAVGSAIKTDPEAGTKVNAGSAVDLFISKGPSPSPSPSPTPPPKVTIPDVKGLPEAAAVSVLEEDDLRVDETRRSHNANVAVGAAIKTDPGAGTKVNAGSAIDLFISKGPSPSPSPSPVAVPKVRGLPEADAIIEITQADLLVGERTRKPNDSIEAGHVVKTSPEAETKVPPRSIVDMVVSNGPSPTPSSSPVPTPSPSPTPEPSPSASPAYPTSGTGFLSGVLLYQQTVPATPERQVVLALVEQGSFGSRALPIDQYVAEGSAPQGFVIGFDWADIDPAASYRVVAAIVDGPDTWISREGAEAITQGASMSGLIVPLWYRSDVLEGEVSGVITGGPTEPSPSAFREVFLVRGDTGAVVGYDARRVTDASSYVFSIPYLLDDIDETVPYSVVGRVTDGPLVWTGPGVPVITFGAPDRVVIPVTEAGDPMAPLAVATTTTVAEPASTPAASATPAP